MSTIIMGQVWAIETISSTDKLVLVSLADNANDDGICWPSIEKIRKRCCLNKSTVCQSIDRLEQLGFLRVRKRFSKSVIYTVSGLPVLWPDQNMASPSSVSGVAVSNHQLITKIDSEEKPEPKKVKDKSLITVSAEALARVKALAVGYEVEFLLGKFTETCQRGEWPKYPDPAFEAWVKKYLANTAELNARRKNRFGEFKPPGADAKSFDPEKDASPWPKRLSGWKYQHWWQEGWGPNPDEPGCLAPAELIEKILRPSSKRPATAHSGSQHA